jgi:hypothetical protein
LQKQLDEIGDSSTAGSRQTGNSGSGSMESPSGSGLVTVQIPKDDTVVKEVAREFKNVVVPLNAWEQATGQIEKVTIKGTSKAAKERQKAIESIIGAGAVNESSSLTASSSTRGTVEAQSGLALNRGRERQKAMNQFVGNIGFAGETGRERALRAKFRRELIDDYGILSLETPGEVGTRFRERSRTMAERYDSQALFNTQELFTRVGGSGIQRIGQQVEQITGMRQSSGQRQKQQTVLATSPMVGEMFDFGRASAFKFDAAQARMQRFDVGQGLQFKFGFDLGFGKGGGGGGDSKITIPDDPWTRKIPPLVPFEFEIGGIKEMGGRKYSLFSEKLYDVRDVLEATFGEKRGRKLPGYGFDEYGILSAGTRGGNKGRRRIAASATGGYDLSGYLP